jgi:hypothetical protein
LNHHSDWVRCLAVRDQSNRLKGVRKTFGTSHEERRSLAHGAGAKAAAEAARVAAMMSFIFLVVWLTGFIKLYESLQKTIGGTNRN